MCLGERLWSYFYDDWFLQFGCMGTELGRMIMN